MSFNCRSFYFLTYTDITRKVWLQMKQGAVRFGFPSVKGRFIHRLSTRKIWILNLPHVSFCSCTVLTQANSSCFSVCKTGLELSVLEGSSRKICTNLPVTAFLWAKEEVFSFGKRKLIYEKWCDFLGWGLYWELFGPSQGRIWNCWLRRPALLPFIHANSQAYKDTLKIC